MRELGAGYYRRAEYRELFSITIDSLTCEDTAAGISKDGELLYIENKLINNSSAYWVQSIFYRIDGEEFCALLERARASGYAEKAIRSGQTTEEELNQLCGQAPPDQVKADT